MTAPPTTLESLAFDWGDAYERHEAPFDRAEVKGLCRCAVAAV
jgi:hypothetical protein